jgi:hypothetical protein
MRILVLAFALAGCAAAVQIGPAAPDPDPVVIGEGVDPTAEIVVYRPGQFGFVTNVAAAPELRLNGQPVGRCAIGKPLRLRLPGGQYTLEAGENARQVIDLEEFQTVYLRCNTVRLPSFAPKATLATVGAETAAREADL